MSGALDWDADAYTVVAAPHLEWANQVLDRLKLRGDETVLDAGCGSGHVTALLLERLPEGRLIGVDASESMIASANNEFGDDPRVELQVGRSPRARASRAGGRGLLERRLPLDPGSRPPVLAGSTPPCAPAGSSSPSAAARATSPRCSACIEAALGRRAIRSLPAERAAAVELRRRRSDTRPRLERAGFELERVLAPGLAGCPSGPARVPPHRDPALAPRAPAREPPRDIPRRRSSRRCPGPSSFATSG